MFSKFFFFLAFIIYYLLFPHLGMGGGGGGGGKRGDYIYIMRLKSALSSETNIIVYVHRYLRERKVKVVFPEMRFFLKKKKRFLSFSVFEPVVFFQLVIYFS